MIYYYLIKWVSHCLLWRIEKNRHGYIKALWLEIFEKSNCIQLQMQNPFDLLPVDFYFKLHWLKTTNCVCKFQKDGLTFKQPYTFIDMQAGFVELSFISWSFPKKKIAADKHDAVIFYILRPLQTNIPPHKQIILKYVIIKYKLVIGVCSCWNYKLWSAAHFRFIWKVVIMILRQMTWPLLTYQLIIRLL